MTIDHGSLALETRAGPKPNICVDPWSDDSLGKKPQRRSITRVGKGVKQVKKLCGVLEYSDEEHQVMVSRVRLRLEASSGTSMIRSTEEEQVKVVVLSSCCHRVLDRVWVVENNNEKVAREGVSDCLTSFLGVADTRNELRNVIQVTRGELESFLAAMASVRGLWSRKTWNSAFKELLNK